MLRIIKMGGSLLGMPSLKPQFKAWLEGNLNQSNLLLVGGGWAADAVRCCDRQGHLTARAAHRLAIEAMRTNTLAVARSWNLAPLVTTLDETKHLGIDDIAIIDPIAWLATAERCLGPLPASWEVTSDSIAAWIACSVPADELVLLKSCSPPQHSTAVDLAAAGYIDTYLPRIAQRLPQVRCVNLRDRNVRETIIHTGLAAKQNPRRKGHAPYEGG